MAKDDAGAPPQIRQNRLIEHMKKEYPTFNHHSLVMAIKEKVISESNTIKGGVYYLKEDVPRLERWAAKQARDKERAAKAKAKQPNARSIAIQMRNQDTKQILGYLMRIDHKLDKLFEALGKQGIKVDVGDDDPVFLDDLAAAEEADAARSPS